MGAKLHRRNEPALAISGGSAWASNMDRDKEESEMDDLPAGIFPEAHPESCYHALRRQGLACTRLNAELFYEMDQLSRNRQLGCSTPELYEIDLWDLCSGVSIWEEPVRRGPDRVLNPMEALCDQDREMRWQLSTREARSAS